MTPYAPHADGKGRTATRTLSVAEKAEALADRLARLLPVRQERLQPIVGQRVFEELADDGRGGGHHVGADLGGFVDVDRVADARDQYLGREIVIVVDEPDVGDQLMPG